MKKILITGGLGFIGVHSVEKWLKEGWDVHIIDNLSSHAVSPDHPLAQKTTVLIKDILNVAWEDLPHFDMILHLASPVGPLGVLKHSGRMAKIILDDIYWAIEGAKYNECPLLFVSTSEVYGYREHKTYLAEDGDKVLKGDFTVRNEYAIAKLLAEIALSNTAKIDKNFKFQIIRPFNVTGEYQLPDGGFVLPRFVCQALSNEDITVYYSGEQIRAFTWVKDIVEGIYLTSGAPDDLWSEEWNIGNEMNEKSILYLAQKVKEFSQSKSAISHVDPKLLHGELFAEAPEKIPNSEKIKSLLKWRPTKYVDEVIVEVVEFWKQQGEAKDEH
jgi:nucleoside-diphosphate-sugar epimerase